MAGLWLRWALLVLPVWGLLGVIAAFYSQQQHIPPGRLGPVLPALFLEAALYLLVGLPRWQECVSQRYSRQSAAFWLCLSALLPYLLYSLCTHTFTWLAFGIWLVLIGLCSTWFLLFPGRLWADLLFLALVAAVLLGGKPLLEQVFLRVLPKLPAEYLGRITWVRTAILAVLLVRRWRSANLGFAPTAREWLIGVQHYLAFLPLAYLLAQVLSFARFRTPAAGGWQLAGLVLATFAVYFIFVGLFEEFFVRGYLQPLLTRALRSTAAGLVLTSIFFGLLHLSFAHRFPNWTFVTLATVAGLFYGVAFLRTGSVRAPMITHALVVTTWRVFFS